MASLMVYFRGEERMLIEQLLAYQPPYDQWFALMIDLDEGLVEILSFFDD